MCSLFKGERYFAMQEGNTEDLGRSGNSQVSIKLMELA